jgi:hypothetical protein
MLMYDVVLLIERQLSELDAQQVASLHEDIEETVNYHVVLPVEEAAARMESSMGSLLGPEFVPPTAPMTGEDLVRLQHECEDSARRGLDATIALLQGTGHQADGRCTNRDPIETLAAMVVEHKVSEAIILTEPHVVKEFFHVDWTSRARRKLKVPILHLLEHETFEEQAGGAGEGSSVL